MLDVAQTCDGRSGLGAGASSREPEVQGVERMTREETVMRLVARVRPLEQWRVARELRRRIRERLDRLDIESEPARTRPSRDRAAEPSSHRSATFGGLSPTTRSRDRLVGSGQRANRSRARRGAASGTRSASSPSVDDGHLGVHGQRQQAEHLAAVGADDGRADEHAAVGVLDDLDEAVVARPVDPARGSTTGSALRRRGR